MNWPRHYSMEKIVVSTHAVERYRERCWTGDAGIRDDTIAKRIRGELFNAESGDEVNLEIAAYLREFMWQHDGVPVTPWLLRKTGVVYVVKASDDAVVLTCFKAESIVLPRNLRTEKDQSVLKSEPIGAITIDYMLSDTQFRVTDGTLGLSALQFQRLVKCLGNGSNWVK